MKQFLENSYQLQWKDAIQMARKELKDDDMTNLLNEQENQTRNGQLALYVGQNSKQLVQQGINHQSQKVHNLAMKLFLKKCSNDELFDFLKKENYNSNDLNQLIKSLMWRRNKTDPLYFEGIYDLLRQDRTEAYEILPLCRIEYIQKYLKDYHTVDKISFCKNMVKYHLQHVTSELENKIKSELENQSQAKTLKKSVWKSKYFNEINKLPNEQGASFIIKLAKILPKNFPVDLIKKSWFKNYEDELVYILSRYKTTFSKLIIDQIKKMSHKNLLLVLKNELIQLDEYVQYLSQDELEDLLRIRHNHNNYYLQSYPRLLKLTSLKFQKEMRSAKIESKSTNQNELIYQNIDEVRDQLQQNVKGKDFERENALRQLIQCTELNKKGYVETLEFVQIKIKNEQIGIKKNVIDEICDCDSKGLSLCLQQLNQIVVDYYNSRDYENSNLDILFSKLQQNSDQECQNWCYMQLQKLIDKKQNVFYKQKARNYLYKYYKYKEFKRFLSQFDDKMQKQIQDYAFLKFKTLISEETYSLDDADYYIELAMLNSKLPQKEQLEIFDFLLTKDIGYVFNKKHLIESIINSVDFQQQGPLFEKLVVKNPKLLDTQRFTQHVFKHHYQMVKPYLLNNHLQEPVFKQSLNKSYHWSQNIQNEYLKMLESVYINQKDSKKQKFMLRLFPKIQSCQIQNLTQFIMDPNDEQLIVLTEEILSILKNLHIKKNSLDYLEQFINSERCRVVTYQIQSLLKSQTYSFAENYIMKFFTLKNMRFQAKKEFLRLVIIYPKCFQILEQMVSNQDSQSDLIVNVAQILQNLLKDHRINNYAFNLIKIIFKSNQTDAIVKLMEIQDSIPKEFLQGYIDQIFDLIHSDNHQIQEALFKCLNHLINDQRAQCIFDICEKQVFNFEKELWKNALDTLLNICKRNNDYYPIFLKTILRQIQDDQDNAYFKQQRINQFLNFDDVPTSFFEQLTQNDSRFRIQYYNRVLKTIMSSKNDSKINACQKNMVDVIQIMKKYGLQDDIMYIGQIYSSYFSRVYYNFKGDDIQNLLQFFENQKDESNYEYFELYSLISLKNFLSDAQSEQRSAILKSFNRVATSKNQQIQNLFMTLIILK